MPTFLIGLGGLSVSNLTTVFGRQDESVPGPTEGKNPARQVGETVINEDPGKTNRSILFSFCLLGAALEALLPAA
jgi:hypothetical protein